jgi:AMP nucleosidase
MATTLSPNLTRVQPTAPFTAQRIDYLLARLQHTIATKALSEPCSVHKLPGFTLKNSAYARKMLADPDSGYTPSIWCQPEIRVITEPTLRWKRSVLATKCRSYHLCRGRYCITL